MTLIEVSDLRRVFRRPDKGPGLKGSLRHLVERRYTEKVVGDDETPRSMPFRARAGGSVTAMVWTLP